MYVQKIGESRLLLWPKPDDTQSLLSTNFNNFINRQIILEININLREFCNFVWSCYFDTCMVIYRFFYQ